MKNFKDKNIVITGAGSGMGRCMSIELAGKGANIIASDLNKKGLEETAELVRKSNGIIYTYQVDVGKEAAVFAFAEKVIKEHGHVDVLINNAGFALGKINFNSLNMNDFHKIMDVNFWGVVNHTKAFIDNLLTRPEASIVNISSLFGIIGVADQVPYCTSKFAVKGFSEALRMELMETKVVVTCVHPGGIKTNIAKNAIHYGDNEILSKFEKRALRIPAEEAASQIINSIKNKQERLLIGSEVYMADSLVRTSPVGYGKVLKFIMDKAMQ